MTWPAGRDDVTPYIPRGSPGRRPGRCASLALRPARLYVTANVEYLLVLTDVLPVYSPWSAQSCPWVHFV